MVMATRDMAMRQIILWQSEPTLSTDDAGLTILSSLNPPKAYFRQRPYYDQDLNVAGTAARVPPLSHFCIKHLVPTPELVYNYGPARPYLSPDFPGDADILQSLIPRTQQGHFNLAKVDPRLWAVIVQVYSNLPPDLLIYRTALSDKYIPSIQRIPATEHFSLLTILELPGCSCLNDDTIIRLTALRTLCVLDASNTPLSAQGIRRLSGTLGWADDGIDIANRRRGPWQLRILSLRNCKQVADHIYQCLESFVLLAVVDLRGTRCTWDREKVPPSFFPANQKQLYYPTTPLEALSLLTSFSGLLPSSNAAFLHIDHLTHPTHEHHEDCSESLDHRVSIARDDSHSHCKINMFYSQKLSNTGPSRTHSHRQILKWGQESLMLYREPPPWNLVQSPPIAMVSRNTRSLEELATIRRTGEQANKSLQRMQDMLSERHRITRTETNSSCHGLKETAKPLDSVPRNPFARPLAGESSESASDKDNGETLACSPHTRAVAKNIMEVPPKSLRLLEPITSLPISRPQAPTNKGRVVSLCCSKHGQATKRARREFRTINDSEGGEGGDGQRKRGGGRKQSEATDREGRE